MGVSKVMRSTGETIMDISGDTVTAGSLLTGYTAHGANGDPITGAVTTAPIDDTLTVQGDAADAKATGDAIAAVSAQLPSVSSISVGNATLFAYGKLRVLQYPAVDWVSGDTVPAGHRPTIAVWAAVTSTAEQSTDRATPRLFVATNGAVTLQINGTAVTEAAQVRGQAVWITA